MRTRKGPTVISSRSTRLAVFAAGLLTALGPALPAAAAEPGGPMLSRPGGVLTFLGGPGAEQVTVDAVAGSGSFLVVTVQSQEPVRTGPGCSALGGQSYFCGFQSGATPLDIRLDGGDDTATWLVPATGVVVGGPGDDRFAPAPGRWGLPGASGVRVNGRDGHDTVDYGQAERGVAVTMGVGADDGRPGDSDHVDVDVEGVVGSDHADRVEGTARPDRIDPGRNRDVVLAFGGADSIHAKDGIEDDVDCGGEPGEAVLSVDDVDDLVGCWVG